MQSSLALKLVRGSLFLVLALIAAMLPRVLDLPEVPEGKVDWIRIAAVIALVMQGIVWTNIIVSHFVQRYISFRSTDGSSITTFKAIGVLVRLFIWIALTLIALSSLGIEIRPLLTGLGIGGLAIAFAVQTTLADLSLRSLSLWTSRS
jgi:small-conductance mechanosensitive channel